jgi:dTDP-glucose 4,6-dehydratase
MSLKQKKVLITGADGFIGSHLTEALVKKNFNVRALVFYNSLNSIGWLNFLDRKIIKNCEIVHGDIRDNSFMLNVTKGVDAVINLAALISIPYSYIAPSSFISTNLLGTYNILEATKKNNISKLILTSTSEVYGSSQYSPIDEKHPLNAQSPYAATKIASDQICLSYYRSFNLPISIIRPFNTFGPRQSLRASIPTMIMQVLNNNKEIKLGSLKTKRDFSYVSDTVSGFLSCIKNKKCIGEVINLGSGFDFSMKQVLSIIQKDLGKTLKVLVDKERIRPQKSEVKHLLSNNKKAKKLLGWEPKYNGTQGFEKANSKTIDWFKKDENNKLYKSYIYNV